MKTRMSMVVLGFLVLVALTANAQMTMSATGKEVMITGDFSCTSCKLSHPETPCAADCCKTCIKAGDPALLTAEDGQMYLLLSGEKQEKMMTPEIEMLLGGKVKVSGMLVKGMGIQVIYVKEIKKA